MTAAALSCAASRCGAAELGIGVCEEEVGLSGIGLHLHRLFQIGQRAFCIGLQEKNPSAQ